MPKKVALKENGVVVGRLTIPDGATDAQIRAAMLRLKEHRQRANVAEPSAALPKTGAIPSAPGTDPMDEEIRCLVCKGFVIVKRKDLAAHMEPHRRELEQIRAGVPAPPSE